MTKRSAVRIYVFRHQDSGRSTPVQSKRDGRRAIGSEKSERRIRVSETMDLVRRSQKQRAGFIAKPRKGPERCPLTSAIHPCDSLERNRIKYVAEPHNSRLKPVPRAATGKKTSTTTTTMTKEQRDTGNAFDQANCIG